MLKEKFFMLFIITFIIKKVYFPFCEVISVILKKIYTLYCCVLAIEHYTIVNTKICISDIINFIADTRKGNLKLKKI